MDTSIEAGPPDATQAESPLRVGVDRNELSYGTIAVGSTSAAETISIVNESSVAIRIRADETNLSPFAIDTSSCTGLIEPTTRCQITIVAAPTRPGPFESRLVLDAEGTNGARARTEIALRGTGSAILVVSIAGDSPGTVKVEGDERECVKDCEFIVTSPTTTLAAQDDGDGFFVGWSGACTNHESQCSVRLDGARTAVAAVFRARRAIRFPEEAWWGDVEDGYLDEHETAHLLTRTSATGTITRREIDIRNTMLRAVPLPPSSWALFSLSQEAGIVSAQNVVDPSGLAVRKFSDDGKLAWTRTRSSQSNYGDTPLSIIPMKSGNVSIAASTEFLSGESTTYLQELRSDGSTAFETEVAGFTTVSVTRTYDGKWVLLNPNGSLRLLNANGTEVFTAMAPEVQLTYPRFRYVTAFLDGFAAVGEEYSTEITDNRVTVVRRYDASGKVLWSKPIPGDYRLSVGIAAVANKRGELVVCGRDTNVDRIRSWVRKFDAAGRELWVRKFLDEPKTYEGISRIRLDDRGNILVMGYHFSTVPDEPDVPVAYVLYQ